MQTSATPDPIDREIRSLGLAKRLLRIEVRTDMITRFTGLSRSRLGAMRRQLRVPKETRHRGPAPWRVEGFVAGADHRCETSALAALLVIYDLIGPQGGAPAIALHRLDVGDRLYEVYEYVHEFFPDVQIDFEALVLLRRALMRGELLETTHCRTCGSLIVVERNDRRHRSCDLCEEARMASGMPNTSLPTRTGGSGR